MRTTVRVAGLKELDAAFGELSKASARGVGRRVLKKAGQPIAERMASLAPDDPTTGAPDLRTSITVGTKLTKRQAALNRKREDKSFVEVFVGTSNAAAVPQEFGTVNMSPQPFARPAWDATKDEALQVIRNELGDEIAKAAARAARRALKLKGA